MGQELTRLGTLLLGFSVVRNFGALTAGQAIGSGVRFLYLIVLAQFVGPEGVGTYIYGFAIGLVLLGLAVFGQGTLLSVRLGKSRANLSRVLSHSFTIVVVMTIVATAAGFAFLAIVEQEARIFWPLALFVLAVWPRAAVWWGRQCYVALEQVGWIPRYEFTFRAGEAVAGTVALCLGAGLLTICVIHLLVCILEAIATLRRLAGVAGVSPALGRDSRLLAPMFRISMYFMVALWLLSLHGQIAILAVGTWLPGARDVGYFGVAVQILSILLLLPLSFAQAALPMVSRGYRSGGIAPATLPLIVKVCFLAGALVAILADSLGVWLITTLFGDDFAEAGSVFVVICWVLGPYAVVILAVQSLNGIGGRALAATTATVMVVTQIVVLAIWLPFGALPAAVVAFLTATALGSVLGVAFIHHRLGLERHGWWLRPVAAVVAAGMVMWSGILPNVLAAPAAIAVLMLLVWQLRVFQGADFQVIRDRLQAAAG